MKGSPDWLKVAEINKSADPSLAALDPGERSDITLGIWLKGAVERLKGTNFRYRKNL